MKRVFDLLAVGLGNHGSCRKKVSDKGKQCTSESGEDRFKLTFEDATGGKLERLAKRLEKLSSSYMSTSML